MSARHDRALLQQAELDETEILARVRRGDRHAYGLLYERHVASSRRVAHAIMRRSSDVDDAVAEAFAAAFAAIRRGKGPSDCFAPYIKSCVRHECFRLMRRAGHTALDHDITGGDADEFERFDETNVVRSAFASLPPRMQTVLWCTEVEGLSHAEVADNTGGSSQAVAQLAVRARRELTANYLQAHLHADAPASRECREIRGSLADTVRGTAGRRLSKKAAAHLAVCADCTAAQQDLVVVNARLRNTPLFAVLAGIGAPVLVKLGWKARLVATIGLPGANLTAAASLAVFNAAAGPVPSVPTPDSAAHGSTIELVGEAAPTSLDVGLDVSSFIAAAGPGQLSSGTDDTDDASATGAGGAPAAGLDRSPTVAPPRLVADTVPVRPSTASTIPPTVPTPATTVVAAPPPSPATTVPATPPPTDTATPPTAPPPAPPAGVEVSVGPGLETDVNVGLPGLLPDHVTLPLPLPPASVAVTIPPTPAITLPGLGTVLPPIDTGAAVDVGISGSGVGADVGINGVDLGLDINLHDGINVDLGIVPGCLPLLGRSC